MEPISIDNKPITETLGTVTVPSGEVWLATITIESPTESGGNNEITHNNIQINGDSVISSVAASTSSEDSASDGEAVSLKTVLVGGDEVSTSGGSGAVTGFEVSDSYPNEAISIQLSSGEATTVPSGEVWRVTVSCRGSGGNQQSSESRSISLNGTTIISTNADGSSSEDNASAQSGTSVEMVLQDGDEIQASGTATQIGGFVVSD